MTDQIAWLIDTNVVSEMMRPHPDPQVAAFPDAIEARESASRPSLSGKSATESAASLQAVAEPTLPTDSRISSTSCSRTGSSTGRWTKRACARIMEAKRRLGEPLGDRVPDAFLAGAAAYRGLAIVTRNSGEFRHTGVTTVDPWTAGPR